LRSIQRILKMSKASSENLRQKISNNLITFLMQGVQLDSFTQQIDTDINIDKMEKLLKIHFVLKDDVIEFVQDLPKEVRRIKTTVNKTHEKASNEIRGKIDWQRTIKSRYKTNPRDKSKFVISRTEQNYNTTENIILKKLLSIINNIVFQLLDNVIEKQYEWVEDWWQDEESLRETVKKIYHRNIYMRRIEIETDTNITPRMISDTIKSRNQFYSRAAELLRCYRNLLNYNIEPEEAEEVLQNTFIKPEKTDVLFELYWVFQILQKVEGEDVTFHLIEGGKNIVAEWEDENYTYKLYHDSTGSLAWNENSGDMNTPEEDGYLYREKKTIDKWQNMIKDLFINQSVSDVLWGGRPDIIIEKYEQNTEELSELFIGEVKYTQRKKYITKGLKELLEYIALAKENTAYITEKENLFDANIKGALFTDNTDGIDIENQEDGNIKIVMYDENFEELFDIVDVG